MIRLNTLQNTIHLSWKLIVDNRPIFSHRKVKTMVNLYDLSTLWSLLLPVIVNLYNFGETAIYVRLPARSEGLRICANNRTLQSSEKWVPLQLIKKQPMKNKGKIAWKQVEDVSIYNL